MNQETPIMNANQPPAPPAGHMNTNVLPAPPPPVSPSFPSPEAQRVAKDPKAIVTHLSVKGHGWIAVDDGTLSMTPDQILGAEPGTVVTFMSEKKMIQFRVEAVQGAKTRFA
jgi:hypothetical protein